MKNLKKKFASQAGFTLVELVVVIAILAILAAVAVPTYSGYITKANEAADYSQLDAIKTAAIFAYTESKKDAATTVETIDVTLGSDKKVSTVTVNSQAVDISAYYKSAEFKAFTSGATWHSADDTANPPTYKAGWKEK